MRDFVSSMITAGVSCNWPYSLDECFETDEDTGQRKLTRVFEEYVSDFDHWTIGCRFLDTFPELEGKIHIKEPDTPFSTFVHTRDRASSSAEKSPAA
jgi:hypothetical protein